MDSSSRLVLGGEHLKATQVLLLMFGEASARYPEATRGFDDALEVATRLMRHMQSSEQSYLDVLAGAGVKAQIEFDSSDAVSLVRLVGRSIRWVPEFDDIQTLTGYTLDEYMQFYLDLKISLGLFGVDDESMARSALRSPLDEWPALPRFGTVL